MTEEAVALKGANAKMSPPLRTKKDVKAIIKGLRDGTIDAIATDHAPHSAEEKSLSLNDAPNGIIGLETSLAISLTFLFHTGLLSMGELISLLSSRPAELLGIDAGVLKKGALADLVIFDPSEKWVVDPTKFKSKARNMPFDGMLLSGKVKFTIAHGEIVYRE
jgi:dihydroorotase